MTYSIAIGNETLPVLIRRRRGMRRMVIRYRPLAHAVSLTLPSHAGIRQGLHFVESKRAWIERQMLKKPERVPFRDGQVIPVLGKEYVLKHIGGRGVVRIGDPPKINDVSLLTFDLCYLTPVLVPGDPQFMERRVREWLKEQAREEITALAKQKAEVLGARIRKISLRDTCSRWGSCSHDGRLSFSWRLAMAPREVLEYLVCHEVAHLQELNHSAAFWALVKQLFPAYKQAQQWLRWHGETLYAYG